MKFKAEFWQGSQGKVWFMNLPEMEKECELMTYNEFTCPHGRHFIRHGTLAYDRKNKVIKSPSGLNSEGLFYFI